MASTRASSPASDAGSPSTPQLTPNSKIKAMLAAIDNESDASNKDSVSGAARSRLMKSINKEKPSNTAEKSREASEQGQDGTVAAADSSSEDEGVLFPRGRVAAAMRAQVRAGSSDTEPRSRESARKSSLVKNRSPHQSSGDDAASDESDVPVVSRKRKIRRPRQSTPEHDAQVKPASPGLFVSPTKVRSANASDSDDIPEADEGDARFKALVDRKRKEMQAREQAAEEFRAKKAAERERQNAILEQDEMSMSDGEGGRRLTQQAKPTRKASKKALEEMHRETQRLSRNQQLAHYATTKKKFSTKDFLKRFNLQAEMISEELPQLVQQTPELTSSSPVTQSDIEMRDTPPTSPASFEDHLSKSLPALPAIDDDELPTLDDALTQVTSPISVKIDKGKGKAVEEATPEAKKPKGPVFKHRPIRVRPSKVENRQISPIYDSDSDLEIVTTKQDKLKAKLDAAFSRVPSKKSVEDQSLYALRMLAHLKSPGKQNTGRNKKSSMTTSELAMSLHQRARQQAAQVKEERLDDLRKRGIIVQSTEERQKEMAEIEDLISKARREAEEITQREKAAAKKERKESGEVDPLGDSSDDEDWEEEKTSVAGEHSGSGSEEEGGSEDGSDNDASGEEDEDQMDVDEAEDTVANPMVYNEASEAEDDEIEAEADLSVAEDIVDDGDIEEEEEELPVLQQNRRARKANVISDDEDELQNEQHTPSITKKRTTPNKLTTDSPVAPTSVLRSATKTFIPGLTVTGPVGLGLTQIFAGTMDESQNVPSQSQFESQQDDKELNDSLAFLRRIPAPSLPPFTPTLEEEETQAFPDSQFQAEKIPESQSMDTETQAIELNFTQSQIHGFDSIIDDSQMSPFPEPTQDVGFAHMTPIKGRFVDAPPSTVETMVMDQEAVPETLEETPIIKRKGKLRRRAPQVFSDDEDAADPVNVEDDLEIDESIFDVMRKASKKKVAVDEFDKKNSKAKEMVHEQADESEDEYAGLGGASDDESGGEADEYVKAMIDDEGGENVDKAKIAAFFADRERATDEKAIEKLYKDIASGMMRRKRGADYDLSDSDDGGEARRRMKRKDFAKMRKALLADERIGKIAENPKRQAFLRAIEDRGSEDEMDFLNDFPEQEEEDSQSQSQADSQQVIPNSQPGDMGPPKRKRSDDLQEERLPPHLRRTKPTKKPSNLSEIRESLSSLIEEPNGFAAPADAGSESEDDLEIVGEDDEDLGPRKEKDKENRDPFALRRTKSSIIDRISLKRENSSNASNNTRLAFSASSNAPGFKVPPLLRRATTNNSLSSTSSNVGGMSATERMAGGSEKDGVKRGGGKNSGVNYFARETERRATVQKTEARREKKRFKGAEVRRKVVGGLLGSGKFE